jgi:alpha-acetolactate decarboxylase
MRHEHRGDEVVAHVAERYASVTNFQLDSKHDLSSRWSRANLEGRSTVWNHRVLVVMIARLMSGQFLNVRSRTDNSMWTSESDALGEWGVVWGL